MYINRKIRQQTCSNVPKGSAYFQQHCDMARMTGNNMSQSNRHVIMHRIITENLVIIHHHVCVTTADIPTYKRDACEAGSHCRLKKSSLTEVKQRPYSQIHRRKVRDL